MAVLPFWPAICYFYNRRIGKTGSDVIINISNIKDNFIVPFPAISKRKLIDIRKNLYLYGYVENLYSFTYMLYTTDDLSF